MVARRYGNQASLIQSCCLNNPSKIRSGACKTSLLNGVTRLTGCYLFIPGNDPAIGIYRFGQNSAAMLIFNLMFIGTVSLCILGLPFWALFAGLELHRIKYVKSFNKKLRRLGNLFGFLILGLWHGALQLLTPLLLVRLGLRGQKNIQ